MANMTTSKATAKSLSAASKARILAATIQLPSVGGQGVLVPGGFVLTAAHCIEHYGSGGMALGDSCLETIKPRKGPPFRLAVHAVEPVSDVAILGAPDNQMFCDDAEAFEAFCSATEPVSVNADDFETEVPVRVHVLSHKGTWAEATVCVYGLSGGATAPIQGGDIESGTSGGPIINDGGRLVGVVSHNCMFPCPHLALPAWAWRTIASAEASANRSQASPVGGKARGARAPAAKRSK
jgi:hypothetical protein